MKINYSPRRQLNFSMATPEGNMFFFCFFLGGWGWGQIFISSSQSYKTNAIILNIIITIIFSTKKKINVISCHSLRYTFKIPGSIGKIQEHEDKPIFSLLRFKNVKDLSLLKLHFLATNYKVIL